MYVLEQVLFSSPVSSTIYFVILIIALVIVIMTHSLNQNVHLKWFTQTNQTGLCVVLKVCDSGLVSS
jgi:hypothetical protein